MEIPVKRFYLPEELVETCPICGEDVYFDNYLSYPETGINKITFVCQAGQDNYDDDDNIIDDSESTCVDEEFEVEYDLQITCKKVDSEFKNED